MREAVKATALGLVILILAVGVIAGTCWAYPNYNVYQQGLAGEAEFKRAEENRKIKVEEARAKLEAAKFESQAEVERARGAAEANAIIGESLKGNEAYLRYLWIQGLHDGTSETIYIPTEANLPILEASRSGQLAPQIEVSVQTNK